MKKWKALSLKEKSYLSMAVALSGLLLFPLGRGMLWTGIGFVLIIAGLGLALKELRCPACGAPLFPHPGNYCKSCGAKIEWDQKED